MPAWELVYTLFDVKPGTRLNIQQMACGTLKDVVKAGPFREETQNPAGSRRAANPRLQNVECLDVTPIFRDRTEQAVFLDTLKHYARLTITDLRETYRKCHPREKKSG